MRILLLVFSLFLFLKERKLITVSCCLNNNDISLVILWDISDISLVYQLYINESDMDVAE